MSGEKNLAILLATMQPKLLEQDFVFCTLPEANYGDFAHCNPIATFQENEGLTLIIDQSNADAAQLVYNGVFKAITLTVHSSLDAVGLTAAVATKLAQHNISANVIAAYYHDHIFVGKNDAQKAMIALAELH